MGVKNLWKEFDIAKKKVKLKNLRGKRLAVDLSPWVRKEERNLFNWCKKLLLEHRIKPFFVLGGQRTGSQQKERKTLVDILGLPCCQIDRKAESVCAFLNEKGTVDGCITEGSDAFLYGAQTVYRKFNIEEEDPEIDEYNISDIEKKADLNRKKLIALNMLVGSDGIPGVGMVTAGQLLKEFGDDDPIKRLRRWTPNEVPEASQDKPSTSGQHKEKRDSTGSACDEGKEGKLELSVRKEMHGQGPHFKKVISEYMDSQENIQDPGAFKWQSPSVEKFQTFMQESSNWNFKESLKELFPLLTRWHVDSGGENVDCLKATRIVAEKKDCYEVEWSCSKCEPSSSRSGRERTTRSQPKGKKRGMPHGALVPYLKKKPKE